MWNSTTASSSLSASASTGSTRTRGAPHGDARGHLERVPSAGREGRRRRRGSPTGEEEEGMEEGSGKEVAGM